MLKQNNNNIKYITFHFLLLNLIGRHIEEKILVASYPLYLSTLYLSFKYANPQMKNLMSQNPNP